MSSSKSTFTLSRLRRSTAIGLFLLVVFVLRIGMVAACTPNDIAESLSDKASSSVAAQVDSGTSGDTDPQHVEGHCLHCGCHYAAALAPDMAQVAASLPGAAHVPYRDAAVMARVEPDLRPPIV